MKLYLPHSSAYDYEAELYAPLKKSFPDHELFLPHEPSNIDLTAESALDTTDVLIAEVSLPSTGQGIELGTAHMKNVPILCFHKEGSKTSSSLRFMTDEIITYANTNDLLQKINTAIQTYATTPHTNHP